MLKFHLDEQVATALATGLRRHGIDVTTTATAGLRNWRDAEHLAFALQEFRVVLTHDRDFLKLHALGTPHAGIAWCRQDKYSIGELLSLLVLMDACYSADEMAGCVEFL